MTDIRHSADGDEITDALRHVLMDAFSLHLLALCSVWNVENTSCAADYLDIFRKRARSAHGAAHGVARLLRRRGASVAFHPTDPPELPRWMFAAPAPQPVMLVDLMARGTAEFVTTIEATLDVIRGREQDVETVRGLTRRLHIERSSQSRLAQLASSLAERPAQLHS